MAKKFIVDKKMEELRQDLGAAIWRYYNTEEGSVYLDDIKIMRQNRGWLKISFFAKVSG